MTPFDFQIHKYYILQKIKNNGIKLVKHLFEITKNYIEDKYFKK